MFVCWDFLVQLVQKEGHPTVWWFRRVPVEGQIGVRKRVGTQRCRRAGDFRVFALSCERSIAKLGMANLEVGEEFHFVPEEDLLADGKM